MDKIELLRKEIESRLETNCYNDDPREELESLLKCIDFIQEDPVSDDLKTLTYNYLRSYGKPEANVEYLTFASCVANWQKEKDNQYFAKKTIETLDEVFEDGRDNMKRQMIDKVSDWLEENLPHYWGQLNANDTDEFIEKFRKYLEKN